MLSKKSISNGLQIWGACITVPLFVLFASALIIVIGFNKQISLLLNVSAAFNINSDTIIEDGYNEKIIPQYTGIIKYPDYGVKFGTLTIKSTGIIDCPVLQGDYDDQLAKGVGHFTGSYLPGEGYKIVLAGHRATYLHKLGGVKIGDVIEFKTNYGVFTYKVTNTKITSMNDTSVIVPDKSHEYLVVYTCYPFDTIGYKTQRFVVYADFLSGPPVK